MELSVGDNEHLKQFECSLEGLIPPVNLQDIIKIPLAKPIFLHPERPHNILQHTVPINIQLWYLYIGLNISFIIIKIGGRGHIDARVED